MFGKFKYLKLYDVKDPARGTKFSAGIDFFIPEYSEDYATILGNKVIRDENGNYKIVVPALDKILIPSGLKVSYPKNRALDFINKSGIASKNSLVVGAELCDWDYTYELFFDIHNISNKDVYLDFGQKIIQGILIPVYYLPIKECHTEEELFKGRKGKATRFGGFGSTGLK